MCPLKYIIPCISLIMSVSCQSMGIGEKFNEKFISICKNRSEDSLSVFYLDPNGISNILVEKVNNTIVLNVKVSLFSLQKPFSIPIDSTIKHVQYGNVNKQIGTLGICTEPKSGKEALDYLKTLKK